MNEALIVSDGFGRPHRRPSAPGRSGFKPWRNISGEKLDRPAPGRVYRLCWKESASRADSWRCSTTSSSSMTTAAAGWSRRWPATTSFHAVRVALDETLRAAGLLQSDQQIDQLVNHDQAGRHPGGAAGDRRIGVVWHTQGGRQEPDHGLLRRGHHPRTGHGQPDCRGPDRPQRPGRPAFSAPSPAARTCCAQPPVQAESRGRPAGQADGSRRRRGLHHHPEVLPRRNRATVTPCFQNGAT